RMCDDCLSGANIEFALSRFNPQHSLEHHRNFLELRLLSGFLPSSGRNHACDAYARMSGVDAARVLFDPFWFGTGRLNDGRSFDQCWHYVVPFSFDITVVATE